MYLIINLNIETMTTATNNYQLIDWNFSNLTIMSIHGCYISQAWAQVQNMATGETTDIKIDMIDFLSYLQSEDLIDDFFVMNINGQREIVITVGGGGYVEWSPSRQDAVERFTNRYDIRPDNLLDVIELCDVEKYLNHPETHIIFA